MKNRKKILFIEGYSYVMTYRIARLFKEKGYETILIRILKQNISDEEFYNKAYDQVINFNFAYHKVTNENILKILTSNLKNVISFFISFIKILKLRPYVIIGRAPISTPIALFKLLFRKTPFIYFPYDIRSQAFPTVEIAKKILPLFEIKADRFCFEHSDGIMHKGAPYELNFLNGRMLGNNIKLPEHQIAFHPYCSKEFCVPINKNKLSKKDKEIHMVYIGGAGQRNKEFYFIFLKFFQDIINQKIHAHFYFSLSIPREKNSEEENLIKEFMEEHKDFPNINYFHIHPPLNPKEIVKEISKYDFGMVSNKIPYEYGLEAELGTGNKYATYLEAGLPFFNRKEFIFTNSLLKKYNIELDWPKDLNQLKKMIKKLDYKKLEKNVLKMRNDYLMEKEFPRLEEFIKNVVAYKKRL